MRRSEAQADRARLGGAASVISGEALLLAVRAALYMANETRFEGSPGGQRRRYLLEHDRVMARDGSGVQQDCRNSQPSYPAPYSHMPPGQISPYQLTRPQKRNPSGRGPVFFATWRGNKLAPRLCPIAASFPLPAALIRYHSNVRVRLVQIRTSQENFLSDPWRRAPPRPKRDWHCALSMVKFKTVQGGRRKQCA